jgi:RNA polymerase sigma-70 factor (ECF subfamily)
VTQGRQETFEELMRAHEGRVLRTALRMMGRLEDAQDAAQEVFLRLYRFMDKLDPERDAAPWLYRMTVNVCCDLLKKRPPATALEYDPPAGGRTVEERLEEAGRRQLLEQGLLTLGEKERAAVVLRDVEGLETAEVARILGSTEGTVRSQVSLARVKLRRFVEAHR